MEQRPSPSLQTHCDARPVLSPSLLRVERTRKRARKDSIESALNLPARRCDLVYLNKMPLCARPLPSGTLHVVDLFCGGGGFSTGAVAAGHRLALVVDSNRDMLACHQANHPTCSHLLMTLGPENEDALVQQIRASIPPGHRWHLHGSPPCTKLSTMQGASRQRAGRTYDADTNVGMHLVQWFLRLVLLLQPPSWSFEEVAMPEVIGTLSMLKVLFPSQVNFIRRLNMCDYGIPQERVRTIAASPDIIHNLLHNKALLAKAPSVADTLHPPADAALVCSGAGKTADPQHTILHPNGSYSNNTIFHNCYRPLHKVSFTCVCESTHRWSRADYTPIRMFTPRENASLQTFPLHYRLPEERSIAYAAVGNAVPPLFAEKLLRT